MTRIQRTLLGLAGLGTLAAWLVAVPRGGWPQPASSPGAAPPAGDETVGLLLLAVPVALVGAVRLLDLKRRRRDDAIQLESQIAEALLRDATLGRLPLAPEAHLPLRRGSPALLALRGEVPHPELRDAAIRLARREAARVSPGPRVEDRITVRTTVRAA